MATYVQRHKIVEYQSLNDDGNNEDPLTQYTVGASNEDAVQDGSDESYAYIRSARSGEGERGVTLTQTALLEGFATNEVESITQTVRYSLDDPFHTLQLFVGLGQISYPTEFTSPEEIENAPVSAPIIDRPAAGEIVENSIVLLRDEIGAETIELYAQIFQQQELLVGTRLSTATTGEHTLPPDQFVRAKIYEMVIVWTTKSGGGRRLGGTRVFAPSN